MVKQYSMNDAQTHRITKQISVASYLDSSPSDNHVKTIQVSNMDSTPKMMAGALNAQNINNTES